MITDRDVWTSANVLLKHHGEGAPLYAVQQADALLEAGDMEGLAVWKRILRAVQELQREQPAEGQARH